MMRTHDKDAWSAGKASLELFSQLRTRSKGYHTGPSTHSPVEALMGVTADSVLRQAVARLYAPWEVVW
jgi:hypothetical protein